MGIPPDVPSVAEMIYGSGPAVEIGARDVRHLMFDVEADPLESTALVGRGSPRPNSSGTPGRTRTSVRN